MSKKSSNFALVIELERHIEILLLTNDCVIVPELGGFMAHHVEARYDDTEALFLPPQRTLGFNPQLRMNDSLLAQSYVEAYDISYPEAVRRIEGEVAELRQHLSNEGRYELNDLGVLSVNDEGKLLFEPCEAGLLTPSLYGLNTFSMPKRMTAASAAKPAAQDTADDRQPVSGHIVIPTAWVRNAVAVAAAILLFFLWMPSVSNSDLNTAVGQQSEAALLPVQPKHKPAATTRIDSSTVSQAIQQTRADSTRQVAAEPAFCIVLASQVTRRNADEFVTRLQKDGISDARVYVNNQITRVVCGSYDTANEAYQALRTIHRHQSLADAWVLNLKK